MRCCNLSSSQLATIRKTSEPICGQHSVGNGTSGSDPLISPEQSGQLYELIEQTGTDVAKMLEYFKISKIEEMTTGMYGRAARALNANK